MTDREYIRERMESDLSNKLWDIVSDACTEWGHPQAVDTCGDAVDSILTEVSFWVEENLK